MYPGAMTDRAVATAATFGVRSSVADLRRVLVRTPVAAGDFAAAGWRRPEPVELLRQHEAFCELLSGLGSEVVVAPPATGLVDACFAYDSAFVTRRGAIGLRMAKPERRGEVELALDELERAGVPTIATLSEAAVADGGDMFWLDEDTLAVGRGYRTNAAAHRELAAILADEDAVVERFDLPHWKGAGFVLHLMSVVSPVADDLAVVHERYAPVPLLEALAERGIRKILVGDDEWETQGGNVLAIRPGVVVLAAGNPKIRRAMEAEGVEVHEYEAGELSKGDGGPTCLTRPILRLQS